ncbi:MAG TPA: alpha/beta hydrolase [Oceanospirillaceae bacterium]|nr:alpha/beta hydrolase [Oceanospirillaceae bacterium]
MKNILISTLLGLGLLVNSAAQAEEIVIKPDALTLNAKLSVANGDITSGPMVLLLHGTLAHNDMEIIATLQELMADEEINSLAPNLSLGVDNRHGVYDCETDHVHKHEDAVTELGYWVDWLKAQGVEQVLIAGHSRGGGQVAAYTRNADAVVKGQFLLAPTDSMPADQAAGYARRYTVPLADKVAEAKALPADGWMSDKTSFIYCLRGGKVSAASFLSYYAPQATHNTVELLQGQALPTMIVAGSADKVVDNLPAQVEAAGLPQVRFELLEDADHYFRDLYADEVLEYMLEQLDEVMQ